MAFIAGRPELRGTRPAVAAYRRAVRRDVASGDRRRGTGSTRRSEDGSATQRPSNANASPPSWRSASRRRAGTSIASATLRCSLLAALVAARTRARRDVQVGRRQGRRPLHRQDAAGGRRQGATSSSTSRASRSSKTEHGAHAGAAPRERAGRRAREARPRKAPRGDRRAATARCCQSYTSEERDRPRAKPRRCSTIDNAAAVGAGVQSRSSTKRKVDVEAKKAELGGKPRAAGARARAREHRRRAREAGRAHRRRRSKEAGIDHREYDADKQRWRELRAAEAEAPTTAAAARNGAPRQRAVRRHVGGTAPARADQQQRPAHRAAAASQGRPSAGRLSHRAARRARASAACDNRGFPYFAARGIPWLNTFTR